MTDGEGEVGLGGLSLRASCTAQFEANYGTYKVKTRKLQEARVS